VARRRLDAELVRRGLVATRSQAQSAVRDGLVLVSGRSVSKPSTLVDAAEPLELVGEPRRFASRAGVKLEAALERFAIDVHGRDGLDAGASTGGFTDCLLRRGAAHVVAVDVGYGQLVWRLRSDARVQVHDRTNVRALTPAEIGGPAQLTVADLSFISLRTVLPALAACTDGVLLPMVKPQFEVGKQRLGAGGVVRDPALRLAALREVVAAARELGLRLAGAVASPLPGPSGNVEFFLCLRRDGSDVGDDTLSHAVEMGPS
jgi:23S rRNA (cytidine1920-2'-O)/16S rRNA (cytidine1409-2'-O)-methyltransferase